MIPKVDATYLEELIVQLNKRLGLIDREFARRSDVKPVLKEGKTISGRPDRDQEDRELRVRDDSGTIQLVIKKDNRLHSVDLTEEDI